MRFKQLEIAYTALLLLLLAAGAARVDASSHSEAPGTAKDRLADDTDTYAFVSPDRPGTVTLIGNWVPLEEPSGGPNFYAFDDNASYYINVDNVGDARDHIVFEFKFTTHVPHPETFLYNTGAITASGPQGSPTYANYNSFQTYTVRRSDDGGPFVLLGDGVVPPNNVGPKSTPSYEALAAAAVATLSDGSKVFAGQRDDPFFVDLGSVFDLLTIRKPPGNMGKGVDGVGGFNVLQIALQIPVTRLTAGGAPLAPSNAVIGIYTSVHRPATRVLNPDGTVSFPPGPQVQVSRLGHPLINEVIIPRQDKDKFNASEPEDDAQFLGYVLDPEPARLLAALNPGLLVPSPPRSDLVAIFLTGIPSLNQPAGVHPAELLRLNMMIPPSARPNRFGVLGGDNAGFPNGRRLADDVADIELRALAGATPFTPGFNHAPNNQLGDGVDFNDRPFLPFFPYQATPHSGFEHRHHPEQHGRELGHDRDDRDAAPTSRLEPGSAEGEAAGAMLRLSGANRGSRTELQYSLEKSAYVTLKVYDLQGRLVRTLLEQSAAPGTFRASWDGRDDEGRPAGGGVYFARLTGDGKAIDSKKITLQ